MVRTGDIYFLILEHAKWCLISMISMNTLKHWLIIFNGSWQWLTLIDSAQRRFMIGILVGPKIWGRSWKCWQLPAGNCPVENGHWQLCLGRKPFQGFLLGWFWGHQWMEKCVSITVMGTVNGDTFAFPQHFMGRSSYIMRSPWVNAPATRRVWRPRMGHDFHFNALMVSWSTNHLAAVYEVHHPMCKWQRM